MRSRPACAGRPSACADRLATLARSWSFLTSSQTVSLVPFRHDEYPRFISGAYPFYASALSTVGAFALFSVLWLAIGGAEMDARAKRRAAQAQAPAAAAVVVEKVDELKA